MANFEGGICSVCATTIQEQTMRQDGHGHSSIVLFSLYFSAIKDMIEQNANWEIPWENYAF